MTIRRRAHVRGLLADCEPVESCDKGCGCARVCRAMADAAEEDEFGGFSVGIATDLPVHEVPVADVEHAVLVRLNVRIARHGWTLTRI